MKIGAFDLDRQVLVVAEIGNNHEGSYALAEELVGKAAEAGVGAVKFQTFRTGRFVDPRDEERFERMKRFELSEDEFGRLCRHARGAGLLFISTPLDLGSARFLGEIADALKIASGDNTFYPLIEQAAESGKPLIVSTGLADLAQIRRAASVVEGVWRGCGVEQDLALLHCVSGYPVPADQANLAAIPFLRRELDCTIGYSDHTIGADAAVMAVAMGARIIEKHFTIDNHYSDFRDHRISADPGTMKRLVDKVRDAQAMLGQPTRMIQDCERDGVVAYRRSIAAARALEAGTVIDRDDITWVRPGGGIPPGREDVVLGRRLNRDLEQGESVLPADLEGDA